MEFLIDKKLPNGEEDIKNLADQFFRRKQKEKEVAKLTEKDRLFEILEKGSRNASIAASLKFLKKENPDVLK